MVALPNLETRGTELLEAYERALKDRSALTGLLERATGTHLAPEQIVDLPSFALGPADFDKDDALVPIGEGPNREIYAKLPLLYVALQFRHAEEAAALVERAEDRRRDLGEAAPWIGADLPIAHFDHWVPAGNAPPIFNTRPAALNLIRADALTAGGRALDGTDVNVVIFDQGLSPATLAALIPGAKVAGGWAFNPWGYPSWKSPLQLPPVPPRAHANMVARNVLSLAPKARLYDLRLLPPDVTNILPYTSQVASAMSIVLATIAWRNATAPRPQRWVFCNAWGVDDRRFEIPTTAFPIRYTSDPRHPLNQIFQLMDTGFAPLGLPAFDQVFAAGNSGQFGADRRSGPGDIGPGNSIFGGNSSMHTLTTGAVRADELWIGYSSQGPGQPDFRQPGQEFCEKPDLCAPSHFVEPDDAAWVSSGTSAACGLVAGAVAALRSQSSPFQPAGHTPAALRDLLRQTATKPPGMAHPYDMRLGHGILNLDAALQAAPNV
jgi:hypothetical protein